MGTSTDDTDRHAAIKLKHLSPTWVKWLDREIGYIKRRNGGYAELTARVEKGRIGPVRWLTSFMPDQWRRDFTRSRQDAPDF